MSDFWQSAAAWAAHSAWAGGGVLLLGWLVGLLSPAPARRQRVAAWAVRAAVVASVLCLMPSWLTVPRWTDAAGTVRPTEVAAESPVEPWYVPDVLEDTSEPSSAEMTAISAPPASAVQTEADTPSRFDADSVVPVVLTLYAVVALVSFAQLAAGCVVLRRIRRDATPAPTHVAAVLNDMVPESSQRPALLVSDRIESPICFGIVRPTIVLPRSMADGATADELRWVLAHELDHLQRGDPATAVWAGVARGLFFFVPWFWAVRRHLVLSQEYLADAAAAAAAAGGRAVDYAAFLVQLSDSPVSGRGVRSRGTLLAAHAVRAGRSDLFRRVTMLLKSGIDRRHPRGWAGVAAGGLLSAAVVLSGLGWAAADDEKPAKPSPRVEKKVPPAEGEGDGKRPEGDKASKFKKQPEAAKDGDDMRADTDDVARLKKQIEAAVKDGDAKEVQRLVGQLERALAPKPTPRDGDGRRPDLLREPVPGVPFRVAPIDEAQAREMQERVRQMLERQAEMLRDNPAQQEAMRRAIEQMRANLGAGNPMMVPFVRGGEGRPLAGRFGTAIARLPDVLSDQLDLPKGTGLVVQDVARDSAAEKAGVKKNDVLLRFAGKDVPADERQFMEMVGTAKGGEKVDVVVLRKGKKETITVDLPEPPKPVRREGEGEKRGGKVAFQSMATTVTDDKFEVKASKGDVRYQIKGRMEDGRPVPVKITVGDGDESKTYDSPKDVPEEHRPALRQLLAAVGG